MPDPSATDRDAPASPVATPPVEVQIIRRRGAVIGSAGLGVSLVSPLALFVGHQPQLAALYLLLGVGAVVYGFFLFRHDNFGDAEAPSATSGEVGL